MKYGIALSTQLKPLVTESATRVTVEDSLYDDVRRGRAFLSLEAASTRQRRHCRSQHGRDRIEVHLKRVRGQWRIDRDGDSSLLSRLFTDRFARRIPQELCSWPTVKWGVSEPVRRAIRATVKSLACSDRAPHQIVPRLTDQGQ